jgi:hypothetical protein
LLFAQKANIKKNLIIKRKKKSLESHFYICKKKNSLKKEKEMHISRAFSKEV